MIRWFAVLACVPLAHAAVCDPAAFQGAYGFQLSGPTAISGAAQPSASVGRLELDGMGGVTGISSVKFAGLLLGNPVTGMYAAKADCSVSWSLQDDSGNIQHFEGTMSEDGKRVIFRQSDPGGPPDGVMMRTAGGCKAVDFHGRFSFTISGNTIDVDTNHVTGRISQSGLIEADGQGNLAYAPNASSPFQSAGTFDVEDDCFVQIELELPSGDGWNFRAMLLNEGHDLLGIESDPGNAATVKMVSRPAPDKPDK
jgi:hypothetical protein